MTHTSPEASREVWSAAGYKARNEGRDIYDYPGFLSKDVPTPIELIDAWKDGWRKRELEIQRERNQARQL